MYSRNAHGRERGDYRIPDNYGGNAFAPLQSPIPEEKEETPSSEHPVTAMETAEAPAPTEAKPAALFSSLLPPKPSAIGNIFGNIGMEELLILGIILLLSGGEGDDDILLLLMLLLFYK